ncbi:NADH-quinone oxidoreductase subunit I [candidate division KSB1 bacterium]|nr:NADH-quinone oxidoreductase subunit I [candidate division KSB1 bacterium]NIR72871.1 NADH-quinone oxidoreductase subunit I [candidate division KSB1 bacterium]NIS25148.1 NADH-quinone oxidoreductase subunit I [candidate division KSB1 bacterium]NIT72059.1 NADH-quinone oxidoreductase subunit I [candidate division KSB1 bacterium]NIU25850.1 NADH-quinone oxidoreductase subunit I [candidate division KSB1 bacterium]
MNVHDKYKPLTFWEKTYIPRVIEGLWLTAKHFFRNMTAHILRLFGIKLRWLGAVTYQYPEVLRPLFPRLRTMHRLTKREDGTPRCVACMMCETVCPARCIYIIAEEKFEDIQIEKKPKSFDIDLGLCIFCGYCVEACPEDAIRMDTGILEISDYTRDGMVLDMQTMLNLEPKHDRYVKYNRDGDIVSSEFIEAK